jgi:antiviral helicase SKI2
MDVLPRLLPDLASQLEFYLLHPELLPIHDTGPAQQYWARRPNPLALLQPAPSAPLAHQLRVVRDPRTGGVTGFEEVSATEAGTTSRNSTSLRRAPGPPEESTRGSASNYPFWPGGFDVPQDLEEPHSTGNGEIDDDSDFSPANLLHCPPGFEAGIDFFRLAMEEKISAGVNPAEEQKEVEEKKRTEDVLNLASVLYEESDVLESWRDAERGEGKGGDGAATLGAKILRDADKFIPEDTGKDFSVFQIRDILRRIRILGSVHGITDLALDPVPD